MFNRVLARALATGLVAGLTLGCDDGSIGQPSGLMSVSSLVPNTGLTIGATPVTINGQGFQSGATVTFGGVAATVSAIGSNAISAVAPIHAQGAVDVVVTNPDGQSATKLNGFSYVFVPPPSIAAVSPGVGSTGGGTSITISGAGFLTGATAMIDGLIVNAYRDLTGTRLVVTAGVHAAGTVDITVRNPDGQSDRLPGSYTYVSPDSFDFNGNWLAYLNNGNDFPFAFIVQNNALVSVTCDDSTTVAFSEPIPVNNGEVSASGSGGVIFSARIVSAETAIGTIKVGTCISANWGGWKESAPAPIRR